VPMLVGLGLHLTERHAQAHRHRPLTHEHAQPSRRPPPRPLPRSAGEARAFA
jgi:hypothetical protein